MAPGKLLSAGAPAVMFSSRFRSKRICRCWGCAGSLNLSWKVGRRRGVLRVGASESQSHRI